MTAYDTQVLADGARAYWKCDEAAGNLIDAVGGLAAVPGGAGIGYQQTGIDGGFSVSLSGATTAHFLVAFNAALDVGNVGSVELWAKLGSLDFSGYPSLVAKANSYQIRFYSNGEFRWENSDISNLLQTQQEFRDLTRFHHIVATRNGAVQALYLDGVLIGTGTSADAWTNGAGVALGTQQSAPGAQRFVGNLQKVAIYPTALTAAQVNNHYSLAAPAVNVLQSRGGGVESSHTIGLNVAAGNQRYLLANLALRLTSGQTFSSVVWTAFGQAPQPLTQLYTKANGVGQVGTEQWGLVAPNVGAGALVATLAFGQAEMIVSAQVFNGVDQVSPVRTAFGTTGTSNPLINVSSLAGDTVICIVALGDSALSLTDNGGQASQWHLSTGAPRVPTSSDVQAGSATRAGAVFVSFGYTLGNSIPWALQAVSLAPAAAGTPITKTAGLVYEVIGGATKQAGVAYEAIQPTLAQSVLPYEAVKPTTISGVAAYEALSPLKVVKGTPYEAIRTILRQAAAPYEALKAARQTRATVYEALGTGTKVAGLFYEVILPVRGRGDIPYEGGIPTGSTTPVFVAVQLVHEALKTLTIPSALSYEALRPLVQVRVVNYEAIQTATKQGLEAYEALVLATRQSVLPYEAIRGVRGLGGVQFEALGSPRRQALLLYEAIRVAQGIGTITYEGGIPSGVVTTFRQTPLDIIEHDHSLFKGCQLFLDVMLSTNNAGYAAQARLEVSIDGGSNWTPLVVASTNAVPISIDAPTNSVFIGTRVRSVAVSAGLIPNQSALYRVTLGGVTNSGANIYRVYHGWGLITE